VAEEWTWVEESVVVKSVQGLHARPARIVWEKARRYVSHVRIAKGRVDVDAKSIFDIMTLDATAGTELVVRAMGSDAKEAVHALVRLLSSELD
jgi:phosphotransferase system HPr (HPr) family protein